eukprot:TRINITY_DN11879_c0_g1_i1.p1 TRINITY_DN11879_c0_g1~~TRINITY_DN11879_c0_g1_i1.p1  ORF type:complete len:123 (+),score=28.77 TRINITY_DN11879_c0_g1_i1:566-934(+)
MKNIVELTMMAVRRKLNAGSRNYCMEIFGYDFIIDEDFKAWLIEINTNPCLEESSKLLQMLLPRMIGTPELSVDDALKLTADVVFPMRRREETSVCRVDGRSDGENMWEYLYQIGGLRSNGM